MKKYIYNRDSDGQEFVFKTLNAAIAKAVGSLNPGYRLESLSKKTAIDEIAKDFVLDNGNRVWELYSNINVANSCRRLAVITEEIDD